MKARLLKTLRQQAKEKYIVVKEEHEGKIRYNVQEGNDWICKPMVYHITNRLNEAIDLCNKERRDYIELQLYLLKQERNPPKQTIVYK